MKQTGLICDGKTVELDCLPVVNYIDEPKYGLNAKEDMRPRGTKWIRSIIVHTTKGIWPQKVLPGMGPDTKLEKRIAKLWSTDARNAGAHLSVDWDGTVCCHADLIKAATYHATVCNEVSVGIEMYQGKDGEVYYGQLEVVVRLIDQLTALLGIQRQMPLVAQQKRIARLGLGGKDFVGVYGHRHLTDNRGPGDPGDAIFEMFAEAGYEQYDVDLGMDKKAWIARQKGLGLSPDGVPGPNTVKELKDTGQPHGLWVVRPF